MAFRRYPAGRDSAVGGAADGHTGLRFARRRDPLRTRDRLTLGDWYHVALTYDGSGKAAGLRLFVDGEPARVDVVGDSLTGPIHHRSPLRDRPPQPRLAVPRTARRPAALRLRPRARRSPCSRSTTRLASSFPACLGRARRTTPRSFATTSSRHAAPVALRTASAELKALERRKRISRRPIPTTMVMSDLKKPRDTFVLARATIATRPRRCNPVFRRCCRRCRRMRRATGWGWRSGWSTRVSADRAGRGEPVLADVLRHRHRQDAGGFRLAGRAAGRIRSCSTGWPPSSCARAGM